MTTQATPKAANPKKVITALAVLSYPWLHTKQKQKDDSTALPKYSATLIFTPALLALPGEQERFELMKAALRAAGVEKFGAEAFAKLVKGEKFGKAFRTDWEAKDYPENSIFFNTRSDQQPGLVYPHAEPGTTKPAKVAAEDIQKTFYAGAIVRASLSAYGYDRSGNKGVTFGLNNLQKIRDGERLDNRAAAEDEFTADLSAAPLDNSDLLS